MFAFILILITTVIGGTIGHFLDHVWFGAFIGFIVGVLLRVGAFDDIFDIFN